MGNERDELLITTNDRQAVNLLMTEDSLIVTRRKTTPLGGVSSHLRISKASSSIKRFPFVQVLSATCTPSSSTQSATTVTVTAVYSKNPQKPAKLWSLTGTAYLGDVEHGDDRNKPLEWCVKQRQRRLRVIVNPHGGKGKGKQLFNETVAPVFKAAGCHVTIDYTGPPDSTQNARNYGRDHKYDDYDVLVPVSGDGIVHELLNGLAARSDAKTALHRTVICPIPAGSGNALQVNLEGPERANDCVWAALAVVKGKELAMDLCSVTQGTKRSVSFLTQAVGLMADLDLGTEHMRWIGEVRFTLGYIQGAITRKTYPFEIAVNIAPEGTDKIAMAQTFNDARNTGLTKTAINGCTTDEDQSLPELKFGSVLDPLTELEGAQHHTDLPKTLSPGWHVIKSRIAWAYGGKLPFVSQDLKLFPPATGDNGLVDLAVMPPVGRIAALTGMDGSEEGSIFWNPEVRYYRCSAFRLTPLNPGGYISVDGEKVAHEPFQVEVHQGLARCMSLDGKFWSKPLKSPENAKA
ncbi:sphinganine kinase lcb4 [Microbotryomycetes sp. JL221]|nr:sphinganine kinase lcb4 [Microbotryomycetes sp. JL221]